MKRWICCAAVLAAMGILWMGLRLPSVMVPETARSFLAEDPPPWQGVLQVWHINDWNVPSSSRSSCLEAAAARVEKKYPGVFVEIKNYDNDAYWAALASGDMPDMICFPGGAEIPRNIPMTQLEIPEGMHGVFRRASEAAGEDKWALPWLGISEILLCDADNVPEDGNEWQTFSEVLQAEEGDRPACSWKNMVSIAIDGRLGVAADWPVWGYRQAWDRFASRERKFLLGSQWDAAAMERRERAGKGYPWRVCTVPESKPALLSVQWIAVPLCDESGKQLILQQLLEVLFAPEVQRRIAETTGALPAVCIEDEWFAHDIQRLCYDRLCEGEVCILRPGYALDSGMVLDAAAGDVSARLMLRRITDRWTAGECEAAE